MIVDLVTFHVRNGKTQEFEAHQQEWLKLMRRARGFINQIVLRNLDDPAEYHAEVRWVNRDYRDRFSTHEDKASQALLQKGAVLLDGAPSHRLYEYV